MLKEQFTEKHDEIQHKMEKALSVLDGNFNTVRAGRANAAILDNVRVDYYGTPTPLAQMAGISVPEPHALYIQPWDASALKEIEKAILASDIGINPNNDGKGLRLSFPPLTEERRKELVKTIGKDAENGKIAVRNVRRDGMDYFKGLKKKNDISEDDLKDIEKEIQDMTDKYTKKVDAMLAAKEKELMAV